MRKLYDSYSPDRLSLSDRAYVSGIHPLELWLAGYLYRHPGASMREIVAASADVRQEPYGWLFKSSRISAQNRRIRTLLEPEAFVPIHAQWKRMGDPFDRLVPRSEEHTSELQSLMRNSYAILRLKKQILYT